jgi:hypothetical protein
VLGDALGEKRRAASTLDSRLSALRSAGIDLQNALADAGAAMRDAHKRASHWRGELDTLRAAHEVCRVVEFACVIALAGIHA